MANRSTFSSTLPRNIKRYIDLSRNPPGFVKRIPVEVVNTKGEKVTRMVIQKDYENDLRAIFLDAHKAHRVFKLKRLSREDINDAPRNTNTTETVEEVSAT